MSSPVLVDHSQIESFPIDPIQFPLARDVDFIDLIVEAGQFITIPRQWFHWVTTDPSTISVSFTVHEMMGHTSNPIMESLLVTHHPIHQQALTRIHYQEVCDHIAEDEILMAMSCTKDVSPPIKHHGEQKKCFYRGRFKDCVSLTRDQDYHGYASFENTLPSCQFLKDINRYIPGASELHIGYKSKLWISLDKTVNSGLHRDPSGNILCVLSGRKHIHLSAPSNASRLYQAPFSQIPRFTEKEAVIQYIIQDDKQNKKK